MKDSHSILNKVNQSLSKNTATEAGQKAYENKPQTIDAINRIFAEFELVYHNQYIKAFPTLEKLRLAKQLWLSHLSYYPAEVIIKAAHHAIQQSEYLPTIRGILKYIEDDIDAFGLPDAKSAYNEACNATSPKATFNWRHLAVYHAGRETGWYFLANNPEQISYPMFKKYYLKLCQKVREGHILPKPEAPSLPEKNQNNLNSNEKLVQINQLKNLFKEN